MNATVANDWRLFSKASAVSGNVTIHAIPAAIASPNLIGAAYIGASPPSSDVPRMGSELAFSRRARNAKGTASAWMAADAT